MKPIMPDDFKPLAKMRRRARFFRYVRLVGVAVFASFVIHSFTMLADTHGKLSVNTTERPKVFTLMQK